MQMIVPTELSKARFAALEGQIGSSALTSRPLLLAGEGRVYAGNIHCIVRLTAPNAGLVGVGKQHLHHGTRLRLPGALHKSRDVRAAAIARRRYDSGATT